MQTGAGGGAVFEEPVDAGFTHSVVAGRDEELHVGIEVPIGLAYLADILSVGSSHFVCDCMQRIKAQRFGDG